MIAAFLLTRRDRRVVEVADEVLPEIDGLDIDVLDVAILLSVRARNTLVRTCREAHEALIGAALRVPERVRLAVGQAVGVGEAFTLVRVAPVDSIGRDEVAVAEGRGVSIGRRIGEFELECTIATYLILRVVGEAVVIRVVNELHGSVEAQQLHPGLCEDLHEALR